MAKIEGLSEEEKRTIKSQRMLSLLHPPSEETMERYGSLENYLDPTFVPDIKPERER